MKAILLAAGMGRRLRPYTLQTPKCLIEVGGKPLLDWWFDWLQGAVEIDSVLVNTHYLAEQVAAHVDQVRSRYRFTLETRHEPELLGTAASVQRYAGEVSEGRDVVVGMADTLVQVDWNAFLAAHRTLNPLCGTLLLFRTEQPRECGITTLDDAGFIRRIVEKPALPESDLAVAGLMILRRMISGVPPAGGDLVGGLLAHCTHVPRGLAGVELPGHMLDVGTPERLEQARKLVGTRW